MERTSILLILMTLFACAGQPTSVPKIDVVANSYTQNELDQYLFDLRAYTGKAQDVIVDGDTAAAIWACRKYLEQEKKSGVGAANQYNYFATRSSKTVLIELERRYRAVDAVEGSGDLRKYALSPVPSFKCQVSLPDFSVLGKCTKQRIRQTGDIWGSPVDPVLL